MHEKIMLFASETSVLFGKCAEESCNDLMLVKKSMDQKALIVNTSKENSCLISNQFCFRL